MVNISSFLILFFSLTQISNGRRWPLSDAAYSPYISTNLDADTFVFWHVGEFLDVLQSSHTVEICSRGIRNVGKPMCKSKNGWNTAKNRVILSSSHIFLSKDINCKASYLSMCSMGPEGSILPTSHPANDIVPFLNNNSNPGDKILVTGLSHPMFQSSVLSTYARQSKYACDSDKSQGWGKSRTLVSNKSVYFVSNCDVLRGHIVAMYNPNLNEVILFSQTFGPMAYFFILIAALLCLYGASGENDEINGSFMTTAAFSILSIACTLSCGLLSIIKGIPFITIEDEIHFWSSIVCGLTMGVLGLLYRNSLYAGDSCIFSLISITVAMYRTPENPYMGILCTIFAIKQWRKIFLLCRGIKINNDDMGKDKQNSNFYIADLDLILTSIYMCITAEIGLVPQFSEAEDWPIYAGVGVFVTFTVAWYKTLIQEIK